MVAAPNAGDGARRGGGEHHPQHDARDAVHAARPLGQLDREAPPDGMRRAGTSSPGWAEDGAPAAVTNRTASGARRLGGVLQTQSVGKALKERRFKDALELRGTEFAEAYRTFRTIARAEPRQKAEGGNVRVAAVAAPLTYLRSRRVGAVRELCRASPVYPDRHHERGLAGGRRQLGPAHRRASRHQPRPHRARVRRWPG